MVMENSLQRPMQKDDSEEECPSCGSTSFRVLAERANGVDNVYPAEMGNLMTVLECLECNTIYYNYQSFLK